MEPRELSGREECEGREVNGKIKCDQREVDINTQGRAG